jgi:hypothetical protein
MRLKIATILVVVSTITTFLTRIIGTLFPNLFSSISMAKVLGIISLFSFLVIIFFYVIFLIDFAKKERRLLKIASILMAIGSAVIFLLFIKSLLTLFKIIPSIYYYATPGFLEALIPCIVSIITLFFFIAFYQTMMTKMAFHLKLATILVVVGSILTVILKSIVLANYLSSGVFRWFLAPLQAFPAIIFLLSIFWFLTYLYFYITFYREL